MIAASISLWILLLPTAAAGPPSVPDSKREHMERLKDEAGTYWDGYVLRAKPSDRCGSVDLKFLGDADKRPYRFGGQVCCEAPAASCSLSLDVLKSSAGACPNDAVCHAMCWTALADFETLYPAVQQGRTKGIWGKIRRHYNMWRWCHDGSADEGETHFLQDLLANHWGVTPELLAIARSDERFFGWVEDRVRGLPTPSLRVIVVNATRRCPQGQRALCERLKNAALANQAGQAESERLQR